MLDKDSFPVFAQYHEDIILAALLYKVDKGFYVDVGANKSTEQSVTKYFYDRGWGGINIEPISRLVETLKKTRTRDINLQLALSSKKGRMKFREYPKSDGLSTLKPNSNKDPNVKDLPHKDYEVDVDRLDNILKQQSVKKIDFLKVDVEGYEFEVLKGNDWTKYRPTIICIESNHRENDWTNYLEEKEYVKFIYDGLNEFYVAKESINITDGFGWRVAILAHNAIRNHHYNNHLEDLKRIDFLEDFTNRQDVQIKNVTKALGNTQKKLQDNSILSLKNKGYLGRLRAAFQGLTTDYYSYKREHKQDKSSLR